MTNPDTLSFTWRIEAGEREPLQIPIWLDDAGEDPAELDSYAISAVIKTEPGGEALYTFPAEDITVTGNVIELVVPGPVSAAWTWSVGWWRLLITADTDDPLDPDAQRVAQGAFIVDPD